jgi:hypothetical protein
MEFWGVGGQPFDGEPGPLGGEVVLHDPAPMRRPTIPEQDRWLAMDMATQGPQEVHDVRAAIGGRARLKVQAHTPAIPPKGQGGGDRHALPVVEGVPQDRSLAPRGSRAADDWELREPALVLEDEPGALTAVVVFTGGHRCRTHISKVMSSSDIALPVGSSTLARFRCSAAAVRPRHGAGN